MKPKDPKLYWYLEKLEELSSNPKAKIIGLSKEEFLEYVDFLFGPIVDGQGKTLFIEDFRYIPYIIDKILKIDLQEYLKAKGNVPQEIIQAAEELGDEGEIERTRLVARNKVEEFIKRQEKIALQTRRETIVRAEEKITKEAKKIIEKTLPPSSANLELIEELTENLEERIFVGFLESSYQEKIQPDDYREIIRQALPSIREISSLSTETITLLEESLTNELPRFTLDAASSLAKLDVSIPREARKEIPNSREAFLPSVVAALSHPKELFWKATTYPVVKTTQVIAKTSLSNEKRIREEIKREREQQTPNQKKLAGLYRTLYETIKFKTEQEGVFLGLSGITSQELERLIPFLEIQEGLGSNDPIVRFLRNQKNQLEVFKKQHPFLARIAELHYQLDSKVGRSHPMVFRGSEVRFPTTTPISQSEQVILNLGQTVGIYQKFDRFPGITTIESIPLQKFADFRSFIARKTLQPIFARLGQTAIGQGIKSGIRGIISKGATQGLIRAGTAILTKLGLTKLASAIGQVIIPIPVIGAVIGAIVGFVIDKAKDLLSKFKQLFTRPEFALGIGAIGGIFVIGGLGTVGVPLLALSGIGLAASAGGILGGASAATVAILAAFFAPLGAPIGALVISIILGLFFLTLFIVFLTASAFIIPAAPTERVSEYFEVTKTVSQDKILNNDLPITLNYVVTLEARQEIEITGAYDERTVTCQPGSNPQFEQRIDLPLNPTKAKEWEAKYSLDIDDTFKDCWLCNTATVIANIQGVSSGERDSETKCVKIGNPPEDCPIGWPTAQGRITQGPGASLSHSNQEAVDIGFPALLGDEVWVTHGGKITFADYANLGGNVVIIEGNCNGTVFSSLYEHLDTINRKMVVGDGVEFGQVVGTLGKTGTEKAHLHYEFRGLEMASPYIPIRDDVLRGCLTSCNTRW